MNMTRAIAAIPESEVSDEFIDRLCEMAADTDTLDDIVDALDSAYLESGNRDYMVYQAWLCHTTPEIVSEVDGIFQEDNPGI